MSITGSRPGGRGVASGGATAPPRTETGVAAPSLSIPRGQYNEPFRDSVPLERRPHEPSPSGWPGRHGTAGPLAGRRRGDPRVDPLAALLVGRDPVRELLDH